MPTPSRQDADAEFTAHFAQDARLAAMPQRIARAIWRQHRRLPRPPGTSAVATMDWRPWLDRWATLVDLERTRDAVAAAAYMHGLLDQGVPVPTAFFNLTLDVRLASGFLGAELPSDSHWGGVRSVRGGGAQLLLNESQLAAADRLLDRFQQLRLQPDNHTCCTVLLLHLKQSRLADSRDLYDEMKRVRAPRDATRCTTDGPLPSIPH